MSEHDDLEKEEDSEHSEDDGEILEESPCGRWQKRNEEVSQRNVPGIDCAYLAMDTEEGVEVVWNEVQFSERKSYKAQERKIRSVFDNLTRIDHANIVKFHRYWIDANKESQKTRVIFITEYMSSGSVKKFLNKTKEISKYKSTKTWKRWCRQILSALNYLHSCDPPIVHGNLTCDTIFIQHNGLLKIGSVAPDAIRNHVKTYLELHKNLHYFAPECSDAQNPVLTPSVDIYAFGICALEMALPKTQLVGESKRTTAEDIERAVTLLEDPEQQNFIRLSISKDPAKRPSARDLLLQPVLFEVPSLKLLSGHAFVKNQEILPEAQLDFYKQKAKIKENVLASGSRKNIKEGDLSSFDVDKFLEDVRNGIYPLTAFALPKPPRAQEPPQSVHESDKQSEEVQGGGTNPNQPIILPETRRIAFAQACHLAREDEQPGKHVIIQIRFEDKMNRQLRCDTSTTDTSESLVSELVNLNFINAVDKEYLISVLEGQPYPTKDPLSQSSEISAKQLETGDYGPPLESILETNDAVFGPATQPRHFNSNNNTAPSELFHLSGTSGTITPELTSPPVLATNGEAVGHPTWNSYLVHEPRALDATLHSILGD